jgi:dihydrodipicolinate synthase/N-acetylneuraminate lyase
VTRPPRIISATPTPFHPDGALDLVGVDRLFQHLAESEVDALFVAGTTGEFPALADAERVAVIQAAVAAAGPERVIAHIGAASAHQAAALTRAARHAGAARFAAVTPYYLPASPRAVRTYFEAICAEAGGCEVYAYLIPQYTGTTLTPVQLARLIDETGLAGAKLSIPGTDFLAEVARHAAPGVELYSGNDALIRQVADAGGQGVVSGVSPACPGLFLDLAAAIGAGEPAAVSHCQRLVDAAVEAIGPSLSYLKTALVDQEVLASATCRMAVDPPDEARHSRISAAWRATATR